MTYEKRQIIYLSEPDDDTALGFRGPWDWSASFDQPWNLTESDLGDRGYKAFVKVGAEQGWWLIGAGETLESSLKRFDIPKKAQLAIAIGVHDQWIDCD